MASPTSLTCKGRRERFAERAVEARIMGNNQIGKRNQPAKRRHVDYLSINHFVGNAGQRCDFRRNWCGWLL
jgi:hypothetical protein